MVSAYASVPQELKELPNWVTWRLEERDGKKTKLPYSLNGRLASSTDKATWHTFNEVSHCEPTPQWGIGFCFNGDGTIGIDLDHCLDGQGNIEMVFRDIVYELGNTYQEKSPSGTGLHIFVRCKEAPYPTGKRKTFKNGMGIEVYSSGRYFTVTGQKFGTSDKVIDIDVEKLRGLCDSIFNREKEVAQPKTAPKPTRKNDLTDDDVYNAAVDAKNGVDVLKLINGDTSRYPSPSEADMGLASMLAFYTKDAYQIERIMRNSKLYRAKWDENKGYLPATIGAAIARCTKQYTKPRVRKAESPTDPSNSETMFADMLVEFLNGDYLYNISTRQWHIWNGVCWEVDERNKIMVTAGEFAKSLFQRAGDKNAEGLADYVKSVLKVNTRIGLGNIVTLAGYSLTRTSSDFDTNEHLLNVRNGTLVFSDGEVTFKDHDKADMCSLVCNCDYDPTVEVPKLWLDHIATISNEDAELEKNIQEIFGYILDGSNPHEHFLILHGSGRNGKSVTLRAIMHLLNNYGLFVNPLSLMESGNNCYSPERLLMAGKRIIVAQEPNKHNDELAHRKDTTCLDSSFLKTASGHDVISARKIHSNDVQHIKVSGMITFVTNPLPKVNDDSLAFWERVLTIPFRNIIPGWQRDPSIEDKFKEMTTGILNWLIEGYVSRGTKRFKLCQAIKDDISEYRLTVDEFAGFCHKRVEETFDGVVKPKEFYDAYCEYQQSVGQLAKPRETFLSAMSKKYNRKHTMNGNVYTQIRLRGEQSTVL